METKNWRDTSALDHALPSPPARRPRGRFGPAVGLFAAACVGAALATAVGEMRVRTYAQRVESAFGDAKQMSAGLQARIVELEAKAKDLEGRISILTGEKQALTKAKDDAATDSKSRENDLNRRLETLRGQLASCQTSDKRKDNNKDNNQDKNKETTGDENVTRKPAVATPGRTGIRPEVPHGQP